MTTPRDLETEYGHCVSVPTAHLIIASHGGASRLDNGTLVFRYPGQLARRVEPIWVNETRSWFVPFQEIRPDIRPQL
jgi:hypothetical protein